MWRPTIGPMQRFKMQPFYCLSHAPSGIRIYISCLICGEAPTTTTDRNRPSSWNIHAVGCKIIPLPEFKNLIFMLPPPLALPNLPFLLLEKWVKGIFHESDLGGEACFTNKPGIGFDTLAVTPHILASLAQKCSSSICWVREVCVLLYLLLPLNRGLDSRLKTANMNSLRFALSLLPFLPFLVVYFCSFLPTFQRDVFRERSLSFNRENHVPARRSGFSGLTELQQSNKLGLTWRNSETQNYTEKSDSEMNSCVL